MQVIELWTINWKLSELLKYSCRIISKILKMRVGI